MTKIYSRDIKYRDHIVSADLQEDGDYIVKIFNPTTKQTVLIVPHGYDVTWQNLKTADEAIATGCEEVDEILENN